MQLRVLLNLVLVAFAIQSSALAQILVDGGLAGDESEYGAALSVQNTNTQFGNATNGDSRYANGGSEIDQVFATVADGRIFVLVAGNLESNFNKLDIFIDSVPGGVNQLNGSNLPARVDPFCCPSSPVATGALQQMHGLQFDAGFAADRYITFSNGNESFSSPTMSTYSLSAYYADLTAGPQGTKREVGFERNAFGIEPGLEQGEPIDQLNNGCSSPAGPCSPPAHEFAEPVDLVNDPNNVRNHRGFRNDIGLRMAINNSNTAGVFGGSGQTAGNPQNVLTGIEFSLPLAVLGNPVGEIKLVAFVNSGPHSFVSNQFAGTGILRGNLGGNIAAINLAAIPGDQYVTVATTPGDFDRDGMVDARDYVIWRADPNRTQLEYETWRAHFAPTAGSAAANAAIPEPATVTLFVFAAFAACTRALRKMR